MDWACGLTTCPQRYASGVLGRTVASMELAGFPRPHIFIDGHFTHIPNFNFTIRSPEVHTYGNWLLSLYELFVRFPNYARYLMSQDDVIYCRNLRAYLDNCPHGPKQYYNLYTHPENQIMGDGLRGWFPSNQLGKGLQAMVFSHAAVLALLTGDGLALRSQSRTPGPSGTPASWCNADGGVAGAFRKLAWVEFCHNPSLVQHAEPLDSSMGNRQSHKATSFQGETWDALSMLETDSAT